MTNLPSSLPTINPIINDNNNGLPTFWVDFFAISLSFISEFWSAMGNIQVKYSHVLDSYHELHRPPYKRCRWWLGFIVYFIALFFKTAALGLAPMSLLAPTSSFVIILNAMLARCYFNEKLTTYGYYGSFAIFIGCIFVVTWGSHEDDPVDESNISDKISKKSFKIFISLQIILMIISIIISMRLTVITRKYRQSIAYNKFGSAKIGSSTKSNINQGRSIGSANFVQSLQSGSDNSIENNNNNNNNNKPSSTLQISTNLSTVYSDSDSGNNYINYDNYNANRSDEIKHIIHAFLMGFIASNIMALLLNIGKIGADLLIDTIFKGNNQFNTHNALPWILVGSLVLLLLCELWVFSEMMRIFDAILVIPIFTSFNILVTMGLAASFTNNFIGLNPFRIIMFILGVLLIVVGVIIVCNYIIIYPRTIINQNELIYY